MRKRCCCWMIPAPGRGQAIAPTMDFPLPKRCEAAWEGKRHLMTHTKGGRCGWAWHGGGKRRHSSTRRARRAVEEWRRLPPPCSPTPPRRMSAHLLGNGKTMDALSLKESNHSRGDGSRIRGMVKAVLALPEVLIRSPRRISRAKILRASAKVDHCSMSNW